MRVLFTCHGGSGHWRPLAPIARALAAAGEEVAFATTSTICSIIAQYGFACFPVDTDKERTGRQPRTLFADHSGEDENPDQASIVWANDFAGSRLRRSLQHLLHIAQSWRPDLIVREISEFAGCVVVERLDVPHVAVQVSAYRPKLHSVIDVPLQRARRRVGLPPVSTIEMLYRYGLLALAPPSFQRRDCQLPATTRFIRYTPFDHLATEPPLDWREHLPPPPAVCATLGTAYNKSPVLFEQIREAARGEVVNLFIATGEREQIDLRQTGHHEWTASYLPQSLVFPHCAAVICHGGFNTVLTAIAHRLPLVVMPIAADQPDNARRCRELGLGTVVDPADRSPAAIRNALRAVLDDASFQRQVSALAKEMESLPGPTHAATLLAHIAQNRTPLPHIGADGP